jgi:hypothetical protein
MDVRAEDHGDLPPREHLDAVIGTVEKHVLKIERFTRDMDRQYLPSAVAGQLLPIGEPRNEDAACGRRLAFAHQVAAGRQRFERMG